jgi:hypothetical protein
MCLKNLEEEREGCISNRTLRKNSLQKQLAALKGFFGEEQKQRTKIFRKKKKCL